MQSGGPKVGSLFTLVPSLFAPVFLAGLLVVPDPRAQTSREVSCLMAPGHLLGAAILSNPVIIKSTLSLLVLTGPPNGYSKAKSANTVCRESPKRQTLGALPFSLYWLYAFCSTPFVAGDPLALHMLIQQQQQHHAFNMRLLAHDISRHHVTSAISHPFQQNTKTSTYQSHQP